MLPEFPEQLAMRERRIFSWFREEVRIAGKASGRLPVHMIEEGSNATLTNSFGHRKEVKMQKSSSPQITIDWDLLHTMSDDVLKKQLISAAESLGNSQDRILFESISETLDEYGQSVDAKGKPFSSDMFLDMLRSVDIDFDMHGQPILPTLFTGSKNLYDSAGKQQEAWRKSKEFQAKYIALMQEKRKNYYVREASRKLVN